MVCRMPNDANKTTAPAMHDNSLDLCNLSLSDSFSLMDKTVGEFSAVIAGACSMFVNVASRKEKAWGKSNVFCKFLFSKMESYCALFRVATLILTQTGIKRFISTNAAVSKFF